MHWPTRFLPALLIAAAVLFAGCGRQSPPAHWAQSGFVLNVPKDAEGFVALYQPAQSWREISAALSPLLNDTAARESWARTPAGRLLQPFLATPAAAEWSAAMQQAADEEVFVMFGQGTAAQMASLQQVKRLFEAARLRNLFTPAAPVEMQMPDAVPEETSPDDLPQAAFNEVIVPLPPAMEEALQRFVREFAIPPVLLGAKLRPDAALPALLEKWAAGLPDKIQRDKITIAPHGEFTRVRLPLALVIPRESAVRARDMLAANIGDPYTATYIVRDLLAKTTIVCFGRIGPYFVISAGTHDSLPALAADPANSLAASPLMSRLAPGTGTRLAALFYADPIMVSLAATPPPFGEYLDAALESALEFAPADRIRPLREAAAPLRLQAEELLRPRISAAAGTISATDTTWRAEMFGGSFAPRLAMENATPLLPADPALAIVWTERWEKDYASKLLRLAASAAKFAGDWFDALGPVFLDESQLTRERAIVALMQPVGGTQSDEAAQLLCSGLGRDTAFALAHGDALLPKAAIAADVENRTDLAAAWSALVSGPTSPRWPAPEPEQLAGGGALYAFPLPLGDPDLSPSLAIDDNLWILGTSAPFARFLATLPREAKRDPSVQSVVIRTAPIAAFAGKWASSSQGEATLPAFVGGFMPQDPKTLAAAAEVLRIPRLFEYSARWENDTLHRVFELSPAP